MRNVHWRLAGLAAMAIFVPPAVAQESISHTSARRGREIVGRAIDAMGGLAALQRLGNVLRELAGVRTDVGQGPRPVPYVRVTDRIGAIPPTINRPRVTSVRDMKQFRASEHVRDTIYGGQPLNFKTIVRRDSAFSVSYDYMYQSLRTFPQGAQQLIGAALFRRYPESLVLNAWRRPGALRHLGARRWEDRPHTVVGYADTDGAQLTLFFDDRTGLLSKVETLGEDGVLGDVTNEVVYEDYRDVAGIRFPFRYIDRVGGVVLQDLRATTLLADTQLSDTIFQHPDFEERKPALPFPTVTTLGDNVYAIMGDYNSIVAVMHDHVIVLEAGGSPRAASAIIAKIRELAPGKPIRYLIATHWNYDHLAGIRSYVAEGTTIVGLPSIKEAAEIAVASKRPLYPDTLAAAPRPLRFEPLGGTRRVFTDGSVMLEVHDISPSPHSDEMLIAYLPNQKILYTADVFDLNVPGHVGTAGHDTADLAAKIAKLGLEVERIVPVHGQIGTMADLQQALSRRGSARTRQP